MNFSVFKILITVLAVLAPFFFPWPVTIGIALIAAVFVPFVALIVGCLLDTLYVGGSAAGVIPYFTVLGAIATGLCYFVQQFIKTRII